MEKKVKLWRIFFIILAILLIGFILLMGRKVIVFSQLDKKLVGYENRKNIYSKKTYLDTGEVIEQYRKDGIQKTIITRKDEDGKEVKLIEVIKENKRTLYSEEDNNRHLIVDNGKLSDVQEENKIIENTEILSSIKNKVLASFAFKMKSVELEGKKCYELSVNSGDLKIQEYVDKDTGLPVKSLKEIKEKDQTKKREALYEYRFDVVTDEDVKMPELAKD